MKAMWAMTSGLGIDDRRISKETNLKDSLKSKNKENKILETQTRREKKKKKRKEGGVGGRRKGGKTKKTEKLKLHNKKLKN